MERYSSVCIFFMPRDFLLLYDEYYPKLYAYVLANVRHQQTAEDIVQQTFERALAHIHTFVPRKDATFGSWLFAIAKHEFINTFRKTKHIVLASEADLQCVVDPETPLDIFLHEEIGEEERKRWQQTLRVIDTLPDEDRELLTLKYLAGMSYEDISILMKKKPNTLAVMLKRALQKIRIALNVCTT